MLRKENGIKWMLKAMVIVISRRMPLSDYSGSVDPEDSERLEYRINTL